MPEPDTENRTLVKREAENRPGSGNIVVVKSGEELLENLQPRLAAMKADWEKIEFDAVKTMEDGYNPRTVPYVESREFKEYAQLLGNWELKEGTQRGFDYFAYRAKMRRLEVLVAHFKPGHDYELTVDEVVEILT